MRSLQSTFSKKKTGDEDYVIAYSSKTNKKLTEHDEQIALNELTTYTLMEIFEFKDIQNDTMTDIHHGKIGPKVITPHQLARQMSLI